MKGGRRLPVLRVVVSTTRLSPWIPVMVAIPMVPRTQRLAPFCRSMVLVMIAHHSQIEGSLAILGAESFLLLSVLKPSRHDAESSILIPLTS